MGEFSLVKLLEGKDFVQSRYVKSLGADVLFRPLSVKELTEIKLFAAKKIKKLNGKLDTKTMRMIQRGGEMEGLTLQELTDFTNAQNIEMLRRSIADDTLTYEIVEGLPAHIFADLVQIAEELSMEAESEGENEAEDFREVE